MIVGTLVVSLALVQRGMVNLAPRDITQPLPPLAPKAEQVYRGPIFAEPVPVRVVQATMAADPIIQTATAKSRPRLAPTTLKPQRALAPDQVAESAPKAVGPPVETCDGMEGEDLARCMRPQILDADMQLRTAYDDAAKAGVKRRELVTYRRQWSRLRKRANSHPHTVLAGFREITEKLEVARSNSQPADSECLFPDSLCAGFDDP